MVRERGAHWGDVTLLDLDDAIDRSAAPVAVRLAITRLTDQWPGLAERLDADPALAGAIIAVAGASRSLTTLLASDADAVGVLAHLDERPAVVAGDAEALQRWKEHEYLRIAARDLLGLDDLPTTAAQVAALARDVVAAAHALVAPDRPLAVIGMGKLGGAELNYASDIDVMFVGDGDPTGLERCARRLLDVARRCFRTDANLRPQGRDGPLVRTLASYEAYWDRWAEPWEFQALLKARFAAGDADLGAAFDAAASRHLWDRTFSADDLRSLRHLKARAEAELARKGLTDREVKRGRGGIRDIEFAVQLLQLVHGGADADLRSPTTLAALDELARAGYVDPDDAARLSEAYVFLRRLEHRLQLEDTAQVYAMPTDVASRTRLARTMGFRDAAQASALEQLDTTLARHQSTVRSIHERLYFRPLLEFFAAADRDVLTRPGAVEARLAAFGFSDGLRTRAAVRELTRGLTRSSRLMQQMLPLLLGWLSDTPDPDLGLLCLRNLAGDRERAAILARTFRDSPEAARQLCTLIGTSRLAADILKREPDLVARLPFPERLATAPKPELVAKASLVTGLKDDEAERQAALLRWKERHLLGVMARDVLGHAGVETVGHDVTSIAEAVLEEALAGLRPQVPFAVVALGRFGGAELSYGSDLDVIFVYEADKPSGHEEGLRIASGIRRVVQGATPATRLWPVDVDLRPEGKQGPLARSVEGYRTYFERWALAWERQAMLRARPVAGDPAVAAAFMGLLGPFVWGPGLSADDQREIRRIKARIERERVPAGEDAQFHLKLGRGSLSDVEWTVQLLQLIHGADDPALRTASTVDGLARLAARRHLDAADAEALELAYRFCERARNLRYLLTGAPGDSLPTDGAEAERLARLMGYTHRPVTQLRDDYRRLTRRCRAVVERVFYGQTT
jgi:[glutamine synthetase] adenylyltransferase / [glutamine synthetase]-adenylyl-L-tyrosine phosphorylase